MKFSRHRPSKTVDDFARRASIILRRIASLVALARRPALGAAEDPQSTRYAMPQQLVGQRMLIKRGKRNGEQFS